MSKITVLIFILSFLIGCSKGISNDAIISQVRDYLDNQVTGSGKRFSELFEIKNIVVKDKMVEGKKFTVICMVTVKSKVNIDPYVSTYWTSELYASIFNKDFPVADNIETNIARFLFEKYESGWRIRNHIKESD